MTVETVQLAIVLLCVAAAGIYLLRRLSRFCRGRGGACGSGGCTHCPAEKTGTPSADQLVSLTGEFGVSPEKKDRRKLPE